MAKRVLVIVIDGLGIGALPDAELYGDGNSHTLDHIAEACTSLNLPNLRAMGLGNIEGVNSFSSVAAPCASYGRMSVASKGKDTTVGHWEIAGRVTEEAFATFQTIPSELIERLSLETKRTFLGGGAASGTAIIEELGSVHAQSASPILYTSADSVLQIAAHEAVVPLEELYEICKTARSIADDYGIARVIARPFIDCAQGPGTRFERTVNRRDFSAPPPSDTLLDILTEYEVGVAGVGKIGDIFAHRSVGFVLHTTSDSDGIDKSLSALKYFEGREALVFTNLIDLDMRYCHRQDAVGAGAALERIDGRIGEITAALGPEDLLIITADHGNDPTTPSTDHSREYVPLLIFPGGNRVERRGRSLGTLSTLADIGATVLAHFSIKEELDGTEVEY
ncbi:MAG: phosphopentomutase [Proteobacteria bacterium]|nr:phosphopentomutase [Pseudomonadota bacterium]